MAGGGQSKGERKKGDRRKKARIDQARYRDAAGEGNPPPNVFFETRQWGR